MFFIIKFQKLVVKPDQLIKRRGMLGLIKLNVKLQEAKKWIDERMGKNIKVSLCSTVPILRKSSVANCHIFPCDHRGGSRIQFFKRGCTTKEWHNWLVTGRNQIFFLQNNSCIRKPQVISGEGGAHLLHPLPRSAPGSPEPFYMYCPKEWPRSIFCLKKEDHKNSTLMSRCSTKLQLHQLILEETLK